MHSRLRRLILLHHGTLALPLSFLLVIRSSMGIGRLSVQRIMVFMSRSHRGKDAGVQNPLTARGLDPWGFPASPHPSSFRAATWYKYGHIAVFSLGFANYSFYLSGYRIDIRIFSHQRSYFRSHVPIFEMPTQFNPQGRDHYPCNTPGGCKYRNWVQTARTICAQCQVRIVLSLTTTKPMLYPVPLYGVVKIDARLIRNSLTKKRTQHSGVPPKPTADEEVLVAMVPTRKRLIVTQTAWY